MKSLVEKKIKSVRVYKGRAVSFYRDTILLPNKKRAIRDYMQHPGAVCIAAFKDRENILMLKQYRYPVKKVITELPAGKIDKREGPLACAKRELLEETGYWPKKIKKILEFYPSPAFATETMQVYLAWDLVHKGIALDEDEFLHSFEMGFDKSIDWIRQGKIKDAKSVITLLTIDRFKLNPYI